MERRTNEGAIRLMVVFAEELIRLQEHTSPIDIELGALSNSNIVMSSCIVIKGASRLVLEKVMEMVQRHNVMMELDYRGIILDFRNCTKASVE